MHTAAILKSKMAAEDVVDKGGKCLFCVKHTLIDKSIPKNPFGMKISRSPNI